MSALTPRINTIESKLPKVAIVKDVKADGVAPQSFSTSYTARHLNTLIDPEGIIQNPTSFTGTGGTNTDIELAAGTYEIEVETSGVVAATTSMRFKARLFNTTTSQVVVVGSTGYVSDISGNPLSMAESYIKHIFTLSGVSTLQIQLRASSTLAGGIAAAFGDEEVYTQVKITKIA